MVQLRSGQVDETAKKIRIYGPLEIVGDILKDPRGSWNRNRDLIANWQFKPEDKIKSSTKEEKCSQ